MQVIADATRHLPARLRMTSFSSALQTPRMWLIAFDVAIFLATFTESTPLVAGGR
jgi:hypothetical protein